jgi:hypothetical protein
VGASPRPGSYASPRAPACHRDPLPAFASLADQLEALLDAHATDTPTVWAAYDRAVQLELAFFDAAYRGTSQC